jgi:hypothetical protein
MRLMTLLFGFGFVKIPYITLPVLLILLPFSRTAKRVIATKVYLKYILILTFFVWFSITLAAFANNDSYGRDIYFIFSLAVKLALVPFIAYELVYDKKFNNSRNTLIVILINIAFVVLGYISKDFYVFSLKLISPGAEEVFTNLHRIRSVGFGAYHLEMAVFGIVYAYTLITSGKTKAALSTIIFVLSSRIFAVFYVLLVMRYKKLFLLIALPIIIYFAGKNQIIYDYFDVFVNLFIHGEINFKNLDHLISMVKIPSYETMLFGDGQFFDGKSFYQKTDIGILRLLFFSGIGGLVYFILLNLYPFRGKKFSTALIELIFFFLVMLKGIAVTSLISWVNYYEKKI